MAALKNPLCFFAVIVSLAFGVLLLPITFAIGPMYWDLFLYFDGAERILNGQIPSVDFSTPVGPLSYYLSALAVNLFPNANPFLLIEWSFLIITAPIMVIIVIEVTRTSSLKAYALLVPFLFYSLAPFNIINLVPHAGIEAWGIYNRHSIQLLYLLLSVLIFIPQTSWRIAMIGYLVVVLFATKITGFLAGGLILFGFFLAGHISLALFVGASIIFWLCLALAEFLLGIVSAYLQDVLALISQNQGGIIRRFFSVGASQFDTILAGGLLCITLLIHHLKNDNRAPAYLLGLRQTITRFCNTEWFLCAVLLFAGLAFETQNSGGQPFAFIWPFLVCMLWRQEFNTTALKTAATLTIAFIMIPPVAITIHKSARAIAATTIYKTLEHDNLKTLGMVSTSPKFYARTKSLRPIYIEHQETFQATAQAGANAAFLIHAQPDFQMLNLKEIDKAITAIYHLESARGKTFASLWYMDFANPFGWLMQRRSPRHVPIGVDPTRTIEALDGKSREALANIDITLIPKCPTTKNRLLTEAHYSPAFTNHERIMLTPCMDAFIKK